jgi:hemoglobin
VTSATLPDHDAAESSLYFRIGGEAAVAAAVDGLYKRIAADRDLSSYFAGIDMAQLKAHQRAFIASAFGGPDRYHGRRLDAAHRELSVTPSAYSRVVDHLVDTLVELEVDAAVIADVTEAVRSLQPQVVADRHQ